MNAPLFFLTSLKHMSARFREKIDASSHFIYHRVLIKFLIKNRLRKINRTWDHFVFRGDFLDIILPKPKDVKKNKRDRKNVE